VITLEEENKLFSNVISHAFCHEIPPKSFIAQEVRAVIKNLNPKKAPSYDLIIHQVLSEIGIKLITQLCNAVLKQVFFHPNKR
jgi:uncharacterized membrane-anchored protein